MSGTTTLRLDQIVTDADHNPRKGDLDGIEALAASIKANGLLQPIIVRLLPAPPETYGVVAGHRRFAAIQSLGWTQLAVIITTAENAHELALTENVMRQQMHPVDEYRAFAKLVAEGLKPKAIAKRFGLKEREVKQRLALGAMLPAMLEHYRAGLVEDDALKLMAQVPHPLQQQLLDEAEGDMIDAWEITRRISEERIAPTHAKVKFVGLDAYKKAGGKIDQDLFGDSQWIADPALLERLSEERRDAIEDEAKTEGWSEVLWSTPGLDFTSHDRLWGTQAEGLEPEERAAISLVLSTGYDGNVIRSHYRLRQETEKKPGEKASLDKPGASMMADPDLTKALSEDMSHVMTGFASVYANRKENRHTVLAMLAYALLRPATQLPLRVKGTLLMPNGANKQLIAEAGLDPLHGPLDYFMELETDDVVDLIWKGASRCFDFSDGFDNGKPEIRAGWYKHLCRNTDTPPKGWKPTAENYFKRMTINQIIEAMAEMKGQAATRDYADSKKGVVAMVAERWAAETNWLPTLLAPVLHDDDAEPTPRRVTGGISDAMQEQIDAGAEEEGPQARTSFDGAKPGDTVTLSVTFPDGLAPGDLPEPPADKLPEIPPFLDRRSNAKRKAA